MTKYEPIKKALKVILMRYVSSETATAFLMETKHISNKIARMERTSINLGKKIDEI